MSFSIPSVVLTTLLASVPYAAAKLSQTGNITLFSDTSCEKAVAVNSWILGRDVCGIVDEGFSLPTDGVFQSYVVNERPWCPRGSRPYFNVYKDEACSELIRSYGPELIHSDLTGAVNDPTISDADGTCVAPGGGYKAMAFICDGFPGMEENESAIPASSVEPESTSAPDIVSHTVATREEGSATTTLEATTTSSISSYPSASVAPTSTVSNITTANTETANTGTATTLPTSVFDGAGPIRRISHNSPMALLLIALGLLA